MINHIMNCCTKYEELPGGSNQRVWYEYYAKSHYTGKEDTV